MRKLGESTEVSEGSETDHTESLKTLDKQAIEDPTLVADVEDKLSRLQNLNELTKDENFNRLGREETTVSDEDSEESTPDEIKDDSDTQESDQADSKDGTDDSIPEAEKKDGDIKIPEAYTRAAIHRGWTQEIVDDLVEKSPESAMKILESLYLDVNNASREWSELGRAKIDAERATATQVTTEAVAQEDPNTTALIAKLRKEYVDDPLIEVVIKGLESKSRSVKQAQLIPQAQYSYETATKRANTAANSAIDQRVNTFFSADVMKPYEKFYGKLELGQIPEDLANGQQYNRLAVLEEAECIIAGHNMRNQKIEIEQAMEKAHFIVTEPIRKQVIRDNLKATATKRKKSMTLRPSDSKRSSDSMNTDSSKPRNRKELELAVRQKLDSVFKRN